MRFARAIAFSIIGLTLLSLFAWGVKNASTGVHGMGFTGRVLRAIAGMPDKVLAVFSSSQVQGVPDSYIKLADGFTPVNKLQHSLYALNSIWDADKDRWVVRMSDLRTDSVYRTWNVERAGWVLDKTPRQFENAAVTHSYAGPGGWLISKLEKTPNLFRLDKDSKVVWTNHELIFHHAIQPDTDSLSVWVCASEIPLKPSAPSVGRVVRNLNGHKLPYQDDFIVKVDVNTGKILFKKGVSEILMQHGLLGMLYGGDLQDPMHLNDVKPATTTTKYWKAGDLFISIKRRSSVLLYRPSTDSLIDVINGPLISQHDVNVISDHEISIFNNRYITGLQYPAEPSTRVPPGTPRDSLECSRAVVFDFDDRRFHEVLPELFLSERIRSNTEGILDLLPNGEAFIEAQNLGIYWVISPQGVVMRKAVAAPIAGYAQGPTWTRIYPALP